MKLRKEIIFGFVFLFLIGITSATVNCDYIQDISYESGTSTEQKVSFHCINSFNSSQVTLSKGGTGNSYFDLDSTTISLSTDTTQSEKTFTLNFDENAPSGIYSGKILFSDNSPTLSFILEVTGQADPSGCQINPSIISYNQDFQQGAKTTETITFNPNNCNGEISISGASIQGGVFVEDNGVSKRKPVSLGIVTSDEININIDTEGLPSKSYDDIKLTFNAYGKKHTIPFIIRVSGSAGGSGEIDINNLPTCSLTNNIININDSYSLVCTNLVTDIEIVPIVDNEYIEGIGLERESNQISWIFRAKKYGNSIIKAGFYYLGFPVGDFFEQEVKIQSSSGQTPGTSLKLLFTPKLEEANENEQVIIQLIDNKTESLVENPEIYVDAIKINPLNDSEKSFPFKFSSGKNYEIRGVAVGYENLIQIVNITNKPLTLTINPLKEWYFIGDEINLTSNQNESKFLFDNEIIEPLNYVLSSSGNHTIKVIKSGYTDSNKTIIVKNLVVLEWNSCTLESEKWKKGRKVTCRISQNSTWVVYLNSTLINSGEGNIINFEINDYGWLDIKADDISIGRINIEKKGWWRWTSIKKRWGWWILGIVIVGLIVYFVWWRGRDEFLEEEYDESIQDSGGE